MKAEVYPGPDGWRWNVRGLNGEILASGEAYVRREDCEHVLALLFGYGTPVDVTVRNHHTVVVDHYTLGRTANSLETVYTGPLEDTTDEPQP